MSVQSPENKICCVFIKLERAFFNLHKEQIFFHVCAVAQKETNTDSNKFCCNYWSSYTLGRRGFFIQMSAICPM